RRTLTTKQTIMFKNYLKTAIRNLLRYKGFSLINIASLAIGVTGCLVIGLFVWDEWQYDRNIPGGENVYRIYDERTSDNTTTLMSPVFLPGYRVIIILTSITSCLFPLPAFQKKKWKNGHGTSSIHM